MIKAAVITALCIPVLSAASASDYRADLSHTRQQADEWQTSFARIHAELEELGVEIPAGKAQAELPETNDTVAAADTGLFFDAKNSRIVYLGNVRLRDARAHLNAAEQLHLCLPDLTEKEKDKATLQPDGAEEGIVNELPEPETPEEAQSSESTGEEATDDASAPPAQINAHCAIADSINNAMLLYAPAAGESIFMQQGENSVRITPRADAPARILADPQGNILLEGEIVDLQLVDKDGGVSTLKTTGGLAYYHAATHTLHAPGSSVFTHPDGTLSCEESLCVVLIPTEKTVEKKSGFMSQFTGLRFDGIDTATAMGQVVVTSAAKENRQAARAEGEQISYNGKTGECSLEGTQCRLQYGNYDIHSDDGLHLLANGDIELRGENIYGTYERESAEKGQILKGTFKAHSHVIFRAELGTVSTEKGLTVEDAEADFSCTGPVHLVLAPKDGLNQPEQKKGMPNLAVTRFGDIIRAHAEGHVIAHQYESGTRRCIGELKAARVDSDLKSGETMLTGEPGMPLIALYDGNRIESAPAPGEVSTMQMLASGDLKLNGDTITAIMVNDDGTTTARCKDYVRLIRAEDRLETGSSTELHAPTAILTTNANLSARLSRKNKTDETPTSGRSGLAGFKFDYNGIKEATTSEGCTLRTEQGSMQCTGPVHIVMDPDDKKAAEMGGMKHATATGNVAIAGKDNTGRLLRATGDKLEIDSATGMKVLSGRRVTVGDADNTHIITGDSAAIHLDARNNVKIVGGKHKTHASNVRQQLEAPNNKKMNKK